MASNERTIKRAHLLARLAAERAGLLERLIGLDEGMLTESLIFDDWTIKDLLAHVAGWDRWELREMKRVASGEVPDLTAVRDVDAFNAAVVAAWRDRTLVEVLGESQDARAAWVAWLRVLPEEEFFQRRLFKGEDWSFPGCVEVQWRHDAEHAAQISAWREAEGLKGKTGPKAILLAAVTLVPVEERESRPICENWTLKDVLGHVADWEWLGVDGLRQMAAGHAPQVGHVEDIDAWNWAHVEARHSQPWEAVWTDFQAARQEFLEGMSQAYLERSFPSPWGPDITPYRWTCVYSAHDREHAQGLSGDFELDKEVVR